MDVENHKYVYLFPNIVIEATEDAGLLYIKRLRRRIAGNQDFITLVVQGRVQDPRLRRIAQLLEGANEQGKEFCRICNEIFDLHSEDPRRFVGYHPRLADLNDEMLCAADFVHEFAKRSILYLELLRNTGSPLFTDARRDLENSLHIQQDLVLGLRWSAGMVNPVGRLREPGPGLLPFQLVGAPNPEDQNSRKYVNRKPVPQLEENFYHDTLKPINWRYDPDQREPTQWSKFLRFSGPYFRPDKPQEPRNTNTFYLPEAYVNILGYYVSRYDQVENNFRNTGRLPVLSSKQQKDYEIKAKLHSMFLAMESGEYYDFSSILHEMEHIETVKRSTEPYIWVKPGTSERQVNFGDGSGRWKPEDINRVMKTGATGMVHSVPEKDEGSYIEMKRLDD